MTLLVAILEAEKCRQFEPPHVNALLILPEYPFLGYSNQINIEQKHFASVDAYGPLVLQ